jgi:signal transduction histidine kinase
LQKWARKLGITSTLFSRHAKEIGIISTTLIIIISYSLFFYLQNITEDNIKKSLFEQQRNRQMESSKAMAEHITANLQSVMYILQGLADSTYLQQGELSGDRIDGLMRDRFNQINATTKVDGLFIADNDDITTYHLVPEGQRSFVNIDISFRDYVQKTHDTLRPVFSNGYLGIDDVYRIAITYPIINKESGQYVGMVGVHIPTIDFFSRYGNNYNIKSQYLAALDRTATHLAHSNAQLIDKNFFGEYTQNFTKHNKDLNNLVKSVLSGKSGDVVYTIGSSERLTTGYHISIYGEEENPTYVVFIVTPTSQIYSQIEDILFTQRIETFSLLAITTAGAIILIIFLTKWNSNLDSEVKRRTGELESANKQLRVHDKMQEEFINIAAHELRTPTQAITGYSELLATEPENGRMYVNPILRNSKRLQRLSEDILDVTRIESQSLKLSKEDFDLSDVILSIIGDYRSLLFDNEDNISLNIVYDPKSITLNSDKERVSQVISNLLSNAIKFTTKEKGTIYVTAERKSFETIVRVKDTGQGIDPEILPKLFTKFTTKSSSGTGLGLFISKSIIEAHGGRIWAENNSDGIGATFSFTLPISQNKE